MEKVGAPREDTQRKIQLDEPFNYIYWPFNWKLPSSHTKMHKGDFQLHF